MKPASSERCSSAAARSPPSRRTSGIGRPAAARSLPGERKAPGVFSSSTITSRKGFSWRDRSRQASSGVSAIMASIPASCRKACRLRLASLSRPARSTGMPFKAGSDASAFSARFRRKAAEKTLPWPRADVTLMSPSMVSMMFLVIDIPSPVPGMPRVWASLLRSKGSKIRARKSSLMPQPVSRHVKTYSE